MWSSFEDLQHFTLYHLNCFSYFFVKINEHNFLKSSLWWWNWHYFRVQEEILAWRPSFRKLTFWAIHWIRSFNFSQSLSCDWFCDLMNCSMPRFPVLHHLPELAQTHVHCVGDAIQLSHSLLSPSPPAFNLSHHQGLF